jgi:hypothetical protein
MSLRSPITLILLLAIVAAACGTAAPDQPAADRSVDETSPAWDADQAIQRTLIIEDALVDGLDRSQAACVIDTTLDAGDFTLDDLAGLDLTARTSSTASRTVAAALADALVECGPSLRALLELDIPGASSIPVEFEVQNDCLTNSYVEAWRTAYTDRFRGASVVTDPTTGSFPEITDATTAMIAACDAGGAVILGASNEGNLDTHALNTLEWTCLVSRLDADSFMPAFPFPEEPGNTLARLGNSVQPDVAFCEAWAATGTELPETAGNGEANG